MVGSSRPAGIGWLAGRIETARHPIRTFWLGFSAVLTVWLALANLAVPWLIRSAYDGRSLPLLNRLISGQATHPVTRYLAEWSAVSRSVAFHLATSALILSLIVVLRGWSMMDRRLPDEHRSTHRAQTAGPESSGLLGTGTIVLLGLWFGLVTGLGEAYYFGAKMLYLDETVLKFRWVSHHVVWMAPAANVVVFGAVTLLILLLGAAVPRVRSRRTIFFVLSSLSLVVWLSFSERLFWWGGLLLAVGLGNKIAGLAESYGDRMRRGIERTVLVQVLVVLVAGLAAAAWPAYQQSRSGRSRAAVLSTGWSTAQAPRSTPGGSSTISWIPTMRVWPIWTARWGDFWPS
ncbi:MAG: hypothetical protein ACE5HQ_11520 [Gemmatimonadota bacterium]